MSTKPAIPPVPVDPSRSKFDSALKESLETIMGRRDTRLKLLPPDADLPAVIAKVNEILRLLQ
ncbi:hypothetical protein BN948_01732 [Hydrogenophaga intermedia]|uniref:Uncharacterized protein n=1 Tax=Hydrogenophaga intermedia TaxID=65786 RepID=A0A1L1PBA1_HYDIT|nr:hypothetical protein BN948_01732 [Hydrogenophaga intermedia]